MKIVSIVGARPQFIKAAPLSHALKGAGYEEILVHTGQHYDYEMSRVFFKELGLSEPGINLGVGSGPHGWQIGTMVIKLEEILVSMRPDWVLVYGDTNSTLAGALTACKLRMPLAHIEAGLRSYNREMPEEHNRVLTDHCSDVLFCPTKTAVKNLQKEGVTEGVHLVGDTMYDAVLEFGKMSLEQRSILEALKLRPKQYLLATLHRPYNVDHPETLRHLIQAFIDIDETMVFPVHPRTRERIANLGSDFGKIFEKSRVKMTAPVSYLDMLMLQQNARLILTDSGGIQKEAYFLGVPCVTLRSETEWVETVDSGWNVLVDCKTAKIMESVRSFRIPSVRPDTFGNGDAAGRIMEVLASSTGY